MTSSPYMPVRAKSDAWGTPRSIFDPLDAEFHFTLDAAANKENHLCDKYFTRDDDGPAQSWSGETVWCNPPYDVCNLARFAAAAIKWSRRGVTTVLLVPCKTDQQWFHDLVAYGRTSGLVDLRWIRGRVKFVGAKNSAPFPSVVIVVRGES